MAEEQPYLEFSDGKMLYHSGEPAAPPQVWGHTERIGRNTYSVREADGTRIGELEVGWLFLRVVDSENSKDGDGVHRFHRVLRAP